MLNFPQNDSGQTLSEVLTQIIDEYGDGESISLPAITAPGTEGRVIITGTAMTGYTLTLLAVAENTELPV
jgi:hypothetical protein